MRQLEPDLEMQIYRNNIKELQEQLQEAYKKIKKQSEIISNLEELLAL
jgi:galactokinase/mevalonate kinase-like predicted kinase|tara:strand:- start:1791 stop:1934 length:144 start_codon:yes stop_codon:yes gene_type:complete